MNGIDVEKLDLQPGDVFATANPQALGWIINLAQKVQSDDGESTYGHAGIITSPAGETFEALWKIRKNNLKAYVGKRVVIARWKAMTPAAFEKGWQAVKVQEGQWYPFGRLFLHLLGMPKVHLPNREVCSELTCHFLISAGATVRSGCNWYGVNPDELVDEWRISKHFDILYEGIL